MEFSKKAWHSLLYKSTFGTTLLPDNICNYFWWLLLAIILFPLCIYGHIINLFLKEKDKFPASNTLYLPIIFASIGSQINHNTNAFGWLLIGTGIIC